MSRNHHQEAAAEVASDTADKLRDIGGQVRDAAAEKYNEVREQASTYIQDGRRRAMKWERSLESHVKEKPLKAVLIAAGVGLLLGLLWKRS